jgi:GNAT superfamily N-acetyltransferase
MPDQKRRYGAQDGEEVAASVLAVECGAVKVGMRIALGDGSVARSAIDPICALYDEVFAAPPFFWREDESQLHRQRLEDLLVDSSFAITTATFDGQLVGFAYGFMLPADTKRWTRLTEPVSVQVASEWPGRTFVLFDFAVRHPYRGRGIGKHLHDRLLGSRSEERATLTVQPTAVDTKRLYARWGWRRVGQMEGGATAAAPWFDVYLRDRLDDLRPAQSMP